MADVEAPNKPAAKASSTAVVLTSVLALSTALGLGLGLGLGCHVLVPQPQLSHAQQQLRAHLVPGRQHQHRALGLLQQHAERASCY